MTQWCLIPNLVLYFLATLLYLLFPFKERWVRFAEVAYVLTLFGALLEIVYLFYLAGQSVFPPAVFISLGLVLLFLWFGRKGEWYALGAIFVPLAFIFLLLGLEAGTHAILLEKLTWLMAVHVGLAILSLVFLLGNFCLGVAFMIHERNLKRKKLDSFTMHLPPLLFSEKRGRLFLHIGFVFLSLVLLSGSALGVGGKLLHLIFALLAWGLYASLLNRRWLGTGGRKMALLSLLGFVSLAFATLWI